METLTCLSSRVFAENSRSRDRELSLLASKEILGRPEVRIFMSPKWVAVGFSQSISQQHKSIHPVSASSLSSSETQTQLLNEETKIQDTKTVHVKFQLQKKCAFGDQFHIVGDDPVLGSWDPLNAKPLEWSKGHIWNVELDVPIGKSIQFKFLLKKKRGKFLWQPDPDRILQTWETGNTISVSEDWENAELQKVIEEEPSSNLDESTKEYDTTIVAENLTQPIALVADVNVEPVATDTITTPEAKSETEKPVSIVAENISNPAKEPRVHTNNKMASAENTARAEEKPVLISDKVVEVEESTLGSKDRAVTLKSKEATKDEGSLASYEADPVLVPGLTPLTPTDSEKKTPSKDGIYNNAARASPTAKTKDHNVPELGVKKEPNNGPQHLNNSTEMMVNMEEGLPGNQRVDNVRIEEQDQANIKPSENSVLPIPEEQDQANSNPPEDNVLHNDIQWGRRTLQKLLSGFGFI